jgi:hypothetical protein
MQALQICGGTIIVTIRVLSEEVDENLLPEFM